MNRQEEKPNVRGECRGTRSRKTKNISNDGNRTQDLSPTTPPPLSLKRGLKPNLCAPTGISISVGISIDIGVGVGIVTVSVSVSLRYQYRYRYRNFGA